MGCCSSCFSFFPGSYVAKGAKAATKVGGPKVVSKVSKQASSTTRRQAFRAAKRSAGIPTSAQYKTHKFIRDTEHRTVYQFTVGAKNKYIINHSQDKFGRGRHFHGADDIKGNPFNKGRYNQYPGHFPEDFNGYR